MYIHTYIHIYMYIHTYVHTYIHTMYIHTYIRSYIIFIHTLNLLKSGPTDRGKFPHQRGVLYLESEMYVIFETSTCIYMYMYIYVILGPHRCVLIRGHTQWKGDHIQLTP